MTFASRRVRKYDSLEVGPPRRVRIPGLKANMTNIQSIPKSCSLSQVLSVSCIPWRLRLEAVHQYSQWHQMRK